MKLPKIFIMTLQHCDMTYGQVTKGAHARGPEIYIPITARHMMPEFWGWPDKFSRVKNPKPSQINQRERFVTVEFHGQKHESRLWGYANKTEFRLRLEELRAAIKAPDDLLLMIRDPDTGGDFWAEIIYKDEATYADLMAKCTHKAPVANSMKQFNFLDEELNICRLRRELFVVVHHREHGEDLTAFKHQKDANEEVKTIQKSNGLAEVIPFLEQIEG